MGCSSCSSSSGGVPTGCGDKGHCSSGGCNKKNSYDWIASREIFDPSMYKFVEVSFKKGSVKDFFINDNPYDFITGDMVVVETSSGYDIGQITLSGELVRLQMKKKRMSEDRILHKIIRKANERDLEKLQEARDMEKPTMVKARVIARTLGLDMKIGDVIYQADKKKATFYYTAEGRVDFRQLVKDYAYSFKIKIEMKQIGARQESGLIGGIGSCGRELCCSTWLSDFKSVNTSAARYQNIAINQTKLSGQCGRLKCCLNYELDTYLDALEDFPEDADTLRTKAGKLVLIKTDIFKGMLYYAYENNDKMRGQIVALTTSHAKEVRQLNQKNVLPDQLTSDTVVPNVPVETNENVFVEEEHEYEDVTGLIELKNEPRKNKNRNNKKGQSNSAPSNNSGRTHAQQGKQQPNREHNPTNKENTNTPNKGQAPANKDNPNHQNKGQEQANRNNPNAQNRSQNSPVKGQTPQQNKGNHPVNKAQKPQLPTEDGGNHSAAVPNNNPTANNNQNPSQTEDTNNIKKPNKRRFFKKKNPKKD